MSPYPPPVAAHTVHRAVLRPVPSRYAPPRRCPPPEAPAPGRPWPRPCSPSRDRTGGPERWRRTWSPSLAKRLKALPTGFDQIRAWPVKPRASRLRRINPAASSDSSTSNAEAAPRLKASSERLPLPAKRSSTRCPERSRGRMLNSASLTRSAVGRMVLPLGALSLLPRAIPPMMRMGRLLPAASTLLAWHGRGWISRPAPTTPGIRMILPNCCPVSSLICAAAASANG